MTKKIDLILVSSATSATIFIIIIWLFYDMISQIIFFVGYTLLIGLISLIAFIIVVIFLAVLYGCWHATESIRTLRAGRREAEATANKANTTIIQNDRQIWVFDHTTGYKHNLTLDPRIYPNGHYTEAEDMEISNWRYIHAPSSDSGSKLDKELPALQSPIPEHVDISDHLVSPSLRNIFLGIGRFPNGQVGPISAPLSQLINIAVGGSSGFGKSVFMQSLAYQIINARENPLVTMLDAQGVTFTHWVNNENLLYPLASEPNDISAILYELVEEMKRRKDKFARWRGVDNLEKYNNAVSDSEQLPIMPVFFDEFGLVSEHEKIAKCAKKISQGGRKVGIPIISASQTWYADEISSAFRANLSTSIQFYARSKSQSRVLLEDSNAVKLLRPGQALAVLPGQPGLIELQTPDISSVMNTQPSLIKVKEGVLQIPEKQKVDQRDQKDEEDKIFVELVESGMSKNKASQKAYNRSYGGDLVGRGNRALREREL